MAPRWYQPLEEHLPKLHSATKSSTYEWIFSRLMREYVKGLVDLTKVPEHDLAKHRLGLSLMFKNITDLSDALKNKDNPENFDDDDDDSE